MFTPIDDEVAKRTQRLKVKVREWLTKLGSHPPDSFAKPDLPVSGHPASQQLGACYAHQNKLGRGNARGWLTKSANPEPNTLTGCLQQGRSKFLAIC